MDETDPTSLDRGLAFARAELGAKSAEALTHPSACSRLRTRLERGFSVQDAVLAEVHRAARRDRQVADEFVAYFLQDMLRVGSGALRAGLRRYLDTGDLVQSVLGDLWSDLVELEFESRARFVSLLGRRMQWKAADHARRLAAGPVIENQAVEPGATDPVSPMEGPSTNFELGEEGERLALVLHRLPPRDSRLLRARLGGESTEEIARREGISLDAARKALLRATKRAQELVGKRS